ncbi:hypothetical protein KI387_038266, partial [Taxus chinensis]
GFQSESLPDDTAHIREELHMEDVSAAPSSVVPSSMEIHTVTLEILDTQVAPSHNYLEEIALLKSQLQGMEESTLLLQAEFTQKTVEKVWEIAALQHE